MAIDIGLHLAKVSACPMTTGIMIKMIIDVKESEKYNKASFTLPKCQPVP